MKLYILIHEKDTDSVWGSSAKPFIDQAAARDAMRQDYEDTIKAWGFDEASQPEEEYKAYCHDGEALVRNDTDIEIWRIEEHNLQVELAVEVKQGFVQAIYANTDVFPEVYDLDAPSFDEDSGVMETDIKAAEMERLKRQPGWRAVY